MELRASWLPKDTAIDGDVSTKVKAVKLEMTPELRARLEDIVELQEEHRRNRAEADALLESFGQPAPKRPPVQTEPMTLPEILLERADRIDELVSQAKNGMVRLPDLSAVSETATKLRQEAAEMSAKGTKVDPLMVQTLQGALDGGGLPLTLTPSP